MLRKPRPAYVVHATLAVSPLPGFTAEGWVQMHDGQKSRTANLVGQKDPGTWLVDVTVGPWMNCGLSDLTRQYGHDKWRDKAVVRVLEHRRVEA